MKALARIMALLGLLFSITLGVNAQTVEITTGGSGKSGDIRPVLVRCVKIRDTTWLFTRIASKYAVYQYSAANKPQTVEHLDIREDGTTVTIKHDGGSTTFFVAMKSTRDHAFEISWKNADAVEMKAAMSQVGLPAP